MRCRLLTSRAGAEGTTQAVKSSELTEGQVIPMFDGSATAHLDPVRINDAKVVAADILAANGAKRRW